MSRDMMLRNAGIAHFTILSQDITTPQDVATNFFLHPDSVGESIAEETTRSVP